MARSKTISLGALFACTLLASTLIYLKIEEPAGPEAPRTSKIKVSSIYGVYRSDLDEEITLREDGTYSYQKVLVTGEDYNFSGQFYFSEEKNFESGALDKVIKFNNYASTFDVWRDDKLANKIPTTFHLVNESDDTVAFCNYGGLDGEYNCFRPSKEIP
jgi:hypothetical protein